MPPVPGGLRFEPVHVEEVATRLATIALDAPAGRVPDAVGPQVLDVPTLVADYRAAANLAGDDAVRGTLTWAEFLEPRSPTPLDSRDRPVLRRNGGRRGSRGH